MLLYFQSSRVVCNILSFSCPLTPIHLDTVLRVLNGLTFAPRCINNLTFLSVDYTGHRFAMWDFLYHPFYTKVTVFTNKCNFLMTVMNVTLSSMVSPHTHNMTITNRAKITISPLRLHAASCVRIPTSTHRVRALLPTVRIRPLNLFSVSSVDLHGTSNTNVLRNNLRVRLSPIKSPVLHKYLNPFKRHSMYPGISKCNAKSCNNCQHVCTNTTITSSVNGRTFSVINNSDLD